MREACQSLRVRTPPSIYKKEEAEVPEDSVLSFSPNSAPSALHEPSLGRIFALKSTACRRCSKTLQSRCFHPSQAAGLRQVASAAAGCGLTEPSKMRKHQLKKAICTSQATNPKSQLYKRCLKNEMRHMLVPVLYHDSRIHCFCNLCRLLPALRRDRHVS